MVRKPSSGDIMKATLTSFISAILFFCFLPHSHGEPPSHKKVITLAAAEFEPYIGKNLPSYGYAYELVKEALSRTGYNVDIQFYTMARARYLAEKGKVDGIIPIFNNTSQQDKFIFSSPFPGNNIGLLKKKSLKIDSLEKMIMAPSKYQDKLKQYKFGIVRGAGTIQSIDPLNLLNKDEVRADLQNLDKLARGRIDFAIIDKYVASDLMVLKRPNLIGSLEFKLLPQASKSFYAAFSKQAHNHTKKLEAFNEGLESMVRDGSLDRIRSKHGLNPFKPKKDQSITLTIGIVDNPEMIVMRELSKGFLKMHPHIKLEWKILTENTLRRRLMSDIAISEGQFDIMMIGPYEAPIWAKNGWIAPINNLPKSYDVNDLLEPIRLGLSYQNELYALPFYGESSITFYRKDLFDKAGIKMPLHPTYGEIMAFSKAIHDPKNDVYGIGLRGKPGWGQNMIFVSTLVNAFGGRWFDKNWHPTIDTPEWGAAISYYSDIMKNYGHPQSALNGWQENRDLFADGKLGIMIDASVLAGTISDPKQSQVHDKVGFSFAPTAVTHKGSHWLWSWALAIPSSSKQAEEAMVFLRWATSKEYIKAVVDKKGWGAVPPGTRHSTYHEEYLNSAPFANITLKAIEKSNPKDFTLKPIPYTGIAFVRIPEYPAIGRQVGIEINKILKGKATVKQALIKSQELTARQMRRSGYIK